MKIYTETMHCSLCKKPIAEFSKDNRLRTVKSWMAICTKCVNESKGVENK